MPHKPTQHLHHSQSVYTSPNTTCDTKQTILLPNGPHYTHLYDSLHHYLSLLFTSVTDVASQTSAAAE